MLSGWRNAVIVTLAAMSLGILPAAASAASPTPPPAGTAPAHDFTVLNLGQGQDALGSAQHFTISNALPTSLNTVSADVVLIPSSQVPDLPAAEVTQLKARLASGAYVIAWADSTSVSPTAIYAALGYPTSAPTGSKANELPQIDGSKPYAAGIVMLAGNVLDHLSFYSNGSVSVPMNALGVQSIFGGLNNLVNHPPVAQPSLTQSAAICWRSGCSRQTGPD